MAESNQAEPRGQRRSVAGTAAEQIDQQLARAALEKQRAGETPNQRELAALRRVEAEREERNRWRIYQSVPKKHYVELAGKHVKVVNEQADRYGLPLRGREIDLAKVLRAFHDLLAANRDRLRSIGSAAHHAATDPIDDDDDPYAPPSAEQLIHMRRQDPERWADVVDKIEQGRTRRFEREKDQGRYILRSEADEQQAAMAGAVRVGLKRTARALRQTLADTDDPAEVERLLTRALQQVCQAGFGHVVADVAEMDDAPDTEAATETPPTRPAKKATSKKKATKKKAAKKSKKRTRKTKRST